MAGARRVLLVGAGTGEATCGILYLASFLRRHGVEAVVRLTDHDQDQAAMGRSLARLIARVKPHVVGVSLKWFHHVARGLALARLIRAIDPDIEIVFGGNSASWWWRELVNAPQVDAVILGDGEQPLLSVVRGDARQPNVVRRGDRSKPSLPYVQSSASDEIAYSHFSELFLSEVDRASFSGWVAPGKGCGENCLYCSGTRGMQKATFGRAQPFLRPVERVRQDHREIASQTWQLRYDFAGSTAAFLDSSWTGVDLTSHSVTYFLWGVPPVDLAPTLSRAFRRAYVVLDIGCFSQTQRLELLRRGLLKPCPTDRQLFDIIESVRALPNVSLEVSGIAALPFATTKTLKEERELVREVLERGCMIGYQRLEAQPGALVTEHPERFGMRSEAKTFDEFVQYFEDVDPSLGSVPMLRFDDERLEAAVERTVRTVDEHIAAFLERRAPQWSMQSEVELGEVASQRHTLGQWLGPMLEGARPETPVSTFRSVDGVGLACAPDASAALEGVLTGAEATAVMRTLHEARTPQRVARLLAKSRADAELVAQLIDSKFLRVVR